MKKTLYFLFLTCIMTLSMHNASHAKPLVADISNNQIAIHSGFTGTQLMMYGARNEPGDIIIVVRGPERPFVVRKKERIWGVWANRTSEYFTNVPQYYGIASSRPLEKTFSEKQREPLKIGSENLLMNEYFEIVETPYGEALIEHLRAESLLIEKPSNVQFLDDTLFKSVFTFPDTLPRGNYTAEVYLFSDGHLVSMHATPLEVVKTGFDAFVYDAAHHNAVLYGIVAIMLALAGGWAASELFQRI